MWLLENTDPSGLLEVFVYRVLDVDLAFLLSISPTRDPWPVTKETPSRT